MILIITRMTSNHMKINKSFKLLTKKRHLDKYFIFSFSDDILWNYFSRISKKKKKSNKSRRVNAVLSGKSSSSSQHRCTSPGASPQTGTLTVRTDTGLEKHPRMMLPKKSKLMWESTSSHSVFSPSYVQNVSQLPQASSAVQWCAAQACSQ